MRLVCCFQYSESAVMSSPGLLQCAAHEAKHLLQRREFSGMADMMAAINVNFVTIFGFMQTCEVFV